MKTESSPLLDKIFAPGDLRDAAKCIDHYIVAAAESTMDREIAEVIVSMGMSVIGILASIEGDVPASRIIESIDMASEAAKREVVAEVVAQMLFSQGGAVL